VELIIATIYDAGDPAHRLRTAPGQKEPPLGGRPERMPAWVQQPANFLLEGRDPSGVRGIEGPWEIYKLLEFRTSFHNDDLYAGHELCV